MERYENSPNAVVLCTDHVSDYINSFGSPISVPPGSFVLRLKGVHMHQNTIL